jgi:2-iminobutanoate/2-iminopropanoate deaminase
VPTPDDERSDVAEKEVIRTDRAPGPFQGAPYNQAIRVGDLVFVAGQLGIALESGELAGPSVVEQTEQIMLNLAAILEAAGSGLGRLVKTTVFLIDLADFAGMNGVYARHVGEQPPARSTVGIAELPSGARVEIEAIGHV